MQAVSVEFRSEKIGRAIQTGKPNPTPLQFIRSQIRKRVLGIGIRGGKGSGGTSGHRFGVGRGNGG